MKIVYFREEWWLNKKRHRENGPAITYFNNWNRNLHYKEYLINGKRHREDGPAVEWSDGDTLFYLNNRWLSFNEYKSWFIKRISDPSYQLTDGDIKFIEKYLE